MYKIPFTQQMINRAIQRAEEFSPKARRSQVKHSGTGLSNVKVAGFLAEEAVAEHLNAELVLGEDRYNYDLVLPDGTNTEVKSKRRTVVPKPNYEVSVYQVSRHQRPDLYMFCSLQYEKSYRILKTIQYENLKAIWLLGQMTPADFFKDAVLWDEGDYDKRNKLILKSKSYNREIRDLDEIGGKNG
tara:strand:- start:1492 stop:2049 length:558 start_codon:yes stop_codon:yes gene_type:complete